MPPRVLRVVTALIGLTAIGCGGLTSSSKSVSPKATGLIQINIQWPTASRSIPHAAQAIDFQIAQDTVTIAHQLIVRPTPSIVLGNLPTGNYSYTATATPMGDGSGTPIATASGIVSVDQNELKPLNLALSSTISTFVVTPSDIAVLPDAKTRVNVIAKDFNGNVVLLTPSQVVWTGGSPSTYSVSSTGTSAILTGLSIGESGLSVIDNESQKTATATVSVMAPGPAKTSWPMFKGNAFTNGRGGGSGATGVLKWSVPLGSGTNGISMAPVIGLHHTILVGPEGSWTRGDLYALDDSTGKVIWKYSTGSFLFNSPAIGADGTVYVSGFNNNLVALDGATGVVKWIFTRGGPSTTPPVIGADGTVYYGANNFTFYAVDGATGAMKWSYFLNGYMWSTPAIGPDGTIYIGSGGSVTSIDSKTGAKIAQYQAGLFFEYSMAIGPDGTVYIEGAFPTQQGQITRFFAFDKSLSYYKWSSDQIVCSGSVAVGKDNTIYMGSTGGKFLALDGPTGNIKWTYKDSGTGWGSCPSIASDGAVYMGTADNRVLSLDGQSGALKWTYTTTAANTLPVVIGGDGTLYVASNDEKLYAIK